MFSQILRLFLWVWSHQLEFFGFFFQQTSGKLLFLFGCSSHSVIFFVKKTFFSFPKKSKFVLIFPLCKRVFFGTPYFAARPYLSFPFPRLLKLYILHPWAYYLTFVLWAPFFSRKEPRMVCLNSRRFVYVSKNRMYDSETFECSNSSQKVQILLKKLGEIRESSSYREKFIQGTDKFFRPNEMFELPSIPVTES